MGIEILILKLLFSWEFFFRILLKSKCKLEKDSNIIVIWDRKNYTAIGGAKWSLL